MVARDARMKRDLASWKSNLVAKNVAPEYVALEYVDIFQWNPVFWTKGVWRVVFGEEVGGSTLLYFRNKHVDFKSP